MIAGMSRRQWELHLTWLRQAHAILQGDTKLAAELDMTVTKAAESYKKERNLFLGNGWTLTYITATHKFIATR